MRSLTPQPVGLAICDSTTTIMDVTNKWNILHLVCFRVTINMPPKRRHRNDSESSNGAVKRIRIVAEENQNEKPTVMCEICSQILKSLETLKSHKKAMHENEQFICTDCGESLESVRQLNSHKRKHKSFLYEKCNKSISLSNKQRHQKLCNGNGNQVVTMHSFAECDY